MKIPLLPIHIVTTKKLAQLRAEAETEMKIDIQAEPKKVRFGDIPEKGYFWHAGTLYLKPRSADCSIKVSLLALDLARNTLTTFVTDDVQVIPEPRPLKVSYDKGD